MGIKYRGGRAYYYENAREGGRVVSRYVGSGALAIAAAQADRVRREEARADREARRADVARMRAEDGRAGELFERVEMIAREALESAGYRRHKRGEWRRCRMPKKDRSRDLVPADVAGRMAILERAESGDKEVLPTLKAMFDDPELGLATVFGDLARTCEKALVAAASGKNLLFREGLERRVGALRDELAGPRPTAIERLLAERAAFCWLALHKCEAEESRARGISLAQAEYQRRMIDSAHRRYLSSLKALATVRKLALPALQVNVAENQVVVGGV